MGHAYALQGVCTSNAYPYRRTRLDLTGAIPGPLATTSPSTTLQPPTPLDEPPRARASTTLATAPTQARRDGDQRARYAAWGTDPGREDKEEKHT